MNRGLRVSLTVVALVLPSAFLLWINSDVPKFCEVHDDCLYFASAKSLVDGNGYRIMSLPGEPAQTKYPPLYPLLLSLAWRLNPHFPANLTPAIWLSWLSLPAMLLLIAAYLPRIGFEGPRKWILLCLIAINPYTIAFSTMLLSEQMFVAFLIGALIATSRADCADRATQGTLWAAAAGVVMGLGYLTRSAGIVAFAALPFYFLLHRKVQLAAAVAAGMAPFVAGWMGWVSLHQLRTNDPDLMYYVDYVGYQRLNVSLELLPVILWKNLDGLLWSLGSLVIPRVYDSLLVKILSEVIGVAMISGVLRIVKQGRAWPYALFSLGGMLLLAIWHFPPSERFVYPLFPIALAGLMIEVEHLWHMIQSAFRHRDRSQRVTASVLALAIGSLMVASAGLQLYMVAIFIPEDARVYRQKHLFEAGIFAWFRQHTPPSVAVLTPRDPLFYLQTGRRATSRPVPPLHWYRDDLDNLSEYPRTLAHFARQHKIDYVYYNGIDFGWTAAESKLQPIVQSNRELEVVFTRDTARVYQVLPPKALAGSPNRSPDDRVDHAPR